MTLTTNSTYNSTVTAVCSQWLLPPTAHTTRRWRPCALNDSYHQQHIQLDCDGCVLSMTLTTNSTYNSTVTAVCSQWLLPPTAHTTRRWRSCALNDSYHQQHIQLDGDGCILSMTLTTNSTYNSTVTAVFSLWILPPTARTTQRWRLCALNDSYHQQHTQLDGDGRVLSMNLTTNSTYNSTVTAVCSQWLLPPTAHTTRRWRPCALNDSYHQQHIQLDGDGRVLSMTLTTNSTYNSTVTAVCSLWLLPPTAHTTRRWRPCALYDSYHQQHIQLDGDGRVLSMNLTTNSTYNSTVTAVCSQWLLPPTAHTTQWWRPCALYDSYHQQHIQLNGDGRVLSTTLTTNSTYNSTVTAVCSQWLLPPTAHTTRRWRPCALYDSYHQQHIQLDGDGRVLSTTLTTNSTYNSTVTAVCSLWLLPPTAHTTQWWRLCALYDSYHQQHVQLDGDGCVLSMTLTTNSTYNSTVTVVCSLWLLPLTTHTTRRWRLCALYDSYHQQHIQLDGDGCVLSMTLTTSSTYNSTVTAVFSLWLLPPTAHTTRRWRLCALYDSYHQQHIQLDGDGCVLSMTLTTSSTYNSTVTAVCSLWLLPPTAHTTRWWRLCALYDSYHQQHIQLDGDGRVLSMTLTTSSTYNSTVTVVFSLWLLPPTAHTTRRWRLCSPYDSYHQQHIQLDGDGRVLPMTLTTNSTYNSTVTVVCSLWLLPPAARTTRRWRLCSPYDSYHQQHIQLDGDGCVLPMTLTTNSTYNSTVTAVFSLWLLPPTAHTTRRWRPCSPYDSYHQQHIQLDGDGRVLSMTLTTNSTYNSTVTAVCSLWLLPPAAHTTRRWRPCALYDSYHQQHIQLDGDGRVLSMTLTTNSTYNSTVTAVCSLWLLPPTAHTTRRWRPCALYDSYHQQHIQLDGDGRVLSMTLTTSSTYNSTVTAVCSLWLLPPAAHTTRRWRPCALYDSYHQQHIQLDGDGRVLSMTLTTNSTYNSTVTAVCSLWLLPPAAHTTRRWRPCALYDSYHQQHIQLDGDGRVLSMTLTANSTYNSTVTAVCSLWLLPPTAHTTRRWRPCALYDSALVTSPFHVFTYLIHPSNIAFQRNIVSLARNNVYKKLFEPCDVAVLNATLKKQVNKADLIERLNISLNLYILVNYLFIWSHYSFL